MFVAETEGWERMKKGGENNCVCVQLWTKPSPLNFRIDSGERQCQQQRKQFAGDNNVCLFGNVK